MRKRNIYGDVLSPKSNSKFIFRIFAYFEQKMAKHMFFVIFSKIVIFGQNLTLPMCSS